MVQHEDLSRTPRGELLLDPAVAAAPDLAVVEVRLGRVDGDDRDPVVAQTELRWPKSCSKWT